MKKIVPQKSQEEEILFKKYRKHLYSSWVSQSVVKNFNKDLETLKLKPQQIKIKTMNYENN